MDSYGQPSSRPFYVPAKSRSISLITLSLFVAAICNGQLMDRLKKRAEEKGIEVSEEVTYDRSAYDPNMDISDGDDYVELEIESVRWR